MLMMMTFPAEKSDDDLCFAYYTLIEWFPGSVWVPQMQSEFVWRKKKKMAKEIEAKEAAEEEE